VVYIMSTLSVDMIEPVGSTLTLGQSGDTITVPSGATFTNNGDSTGFGGKVAQVIQVVKTDVLSTAVTGAVFVDMTGMTVAITPVATTSKVLVFWNVYVGGTAAWRVYINLLRDSATPLLGDVRGSRTRVSTGTQIVHADGTASSSMIYLDSPATTSALTYKLQWTLQSSGTVLLNRSQSDSDATTSSTGASTITVMEITA
jgi:hypothetical protein